MLKRGYYNQFGGAFLPEILTATFDELEQVYEAAKADPAFWNQYKEVMATYSCRPTPLTFAQNLTRHFGGARIYIKREDLNHTGAHKANNVMGQGLLVKRMGKTRVIAETGAGQHGVATATMAARFGFDCTIYMGEVDVERQRPNVFWMEQLGATVVPVTDGTRILKDAINEAFPRLGHQYGHHPLCLGYRLRPHPFPEMVTWFQSIIGQEARKQIMDAEGRLPVRVFACVGGGSNAMGLFSAAFWKTRGTGGSGSRRARGIDSAKPTPRGSAPMTPASASPRGTRPIFSRTTTARCRRPTPLPPVWIMSAFRPSWPISRRPVRPASKRPRMKRWWKPLR
jgi:tryptophan synthase beta chain